MIDLIAIDLIEFHDLPVKSIRIQTDPVLEFELVVEILDEQKNGYKLTQLSFKEIEFLHFDSFELNRNLDIEINSFKYFINGNSFHGQFIFLSRFGRPNSKIDFASQFVEVINLYSNYSKDYS